MVNIIVVIGVATSAVLFAWTWNPTCLVPLLAGLVYLVARAVEKRLRASSGQTDSDLDKQVQEYKSLMFTIGMGPAFLLLAMHSFFANGWNTSGVMCGVCSIFFFGLWAYRKGGWKKASPTRAADPDAAVDRPRD
jgi:hypothetical protein